MLLRPFSPGSYQRYFAKRSDGLRADDTENFLVATTQLQNKGATYLKGYL